MFKMYYSKGFFAINLPPTLLLLQTHWSHCSGHFLKQLRTSSNECAFFIKNGMRTLLPGPSHRKGTASIFTVCAHLYYTASLFYFLFFHWLIYVLSKMWTVDETSSVYSLFNLSAQLSLKYAEKWVGYYKCLINTYL